MSDLEMNLSGIGDRQKMVIRVIKSLNKGKLFVYHGMRGSVHAEVGSFVLGSDLIDSLLQRNILIPAPPPNPDKFYPGKHYQIHPDLL